MENKRFIHITRILSGCLTRRGMLATVASVAGFQLSGAAAIRARASKKRHEATKRLRAQAKPDREVSDLTADFTSEARGFPVQIHQGTTLALAFGDHLLFAVPGA